MDLEEVKSRYPELLKKYLFEDKEEEALYGAYKLGKECFEAKVGIEEMMNLHTLSLEAIIKDLPPSKVHEIVLKSSNLLIEFSIRFGLVCQNYFEMLQQTDERIRIAFYQAGKALTAGLDVHKMASNILDIVKNLTEAAGCAIMLMEEEKKIIKVSEGLESDQVEILMLEALEESRAEIIYDLTEKKYPVISINGNEIQSVLILPLIFKSKTFGNLGIFLTHPHSYEEKEINLLRSFAYHAATAINNAYLFIELSRHDRMIKTLYDVDRVISRSLELEDILESALTKAIEVTENNVGVVYLLEEDGITLHMKAHIQISPELARTFKRIKVGQGVSGMAVKSGKPVIMENISEYPSPELVQPLLKEGIVSIAGIPLIAKDKIVGAMTLASRKHRTFSSDDIDILSSIGNQIGVAIENSRLFTELEKHNKMLNTLYAIENVVSRSLELEEIFKVSLSKVLELTGTEAGTLYSIENDILMLEAFQGLSPEFKKRAIIREKGEGIPGIAAQLKKAITMDISEFPSPSLLPFVKAEGLVSFIGTPLMSKGKVVGALALGTKEKHAFTQEDLDLLFSIGNVIGIAVENAQLYKGSLENLKKLQTAYEELETLDKMKDEFISNVSHELKTPLVSIKGYGELLYDEKVGSLMGEQKKSLEAIIRNANRLTRLIDSILFLSRLQAGKVEFHFEPVELDEIIEICVNDMKSMMDKKKISFEKNIQEISRVRGDRDKYMEVINNLLDNSIKFTQMGGKIRIEAINEGDNVHVSVSDNGIGIPEEIIPRLFTRFYQVDASTSRKYGGSGLGLYITKTIVDTFGGKIWIESYPGKGTTVHMLLPIAEPEKK